MNELFLVTIFHDQGRKTASMMWVGSYVITRNPGLYFNKKVLNTSSFLIEYNNIIIRYLVAI